MNTAIAQAECIPEHGLDKRRHPRVELNMRALLITGDGIDDVEAVVMNLAPGGIFVQAGTLPPCGTRIELSFRMLANIQCRASGQVVRHDQASGGFAVHFNHTNPAMDSFTQQLLKLPKRLHVVYLADVLHPRLRVVPAAGAR